MIGKEEAQFIDSTTDSKIKDNVLIGWSTERGKKRK